MQASSPQVSVIIPTYNRGHLIQPAIESVLGQTYLDYELIIIDDASKDKTVEFILSTYGHISKLRLLPLEQNRGAAGARNAGIQIAKGKFVAFLDSDDQWEPNFLERLITELTAKSNAVLTFCNATETDTESTSAYCNFKPWDNYPKVTHRILLTGDIISTMSVVMTRRDALLQAGPMNETLKICHDKDLYLRLLSLGDFVHVPEILVKKIAHDGNLVKQQIQLVEEDQEVINLFFSDNSNSPYKSYEAEARSYVLLRKAKVVRWFQKNYLLSFYLFMQALTLSPAYVLRQIQNKF